MSRLARLASALRGRGSALVFLGAAAALAGAGTANAATVASPAQPQTISATAASPVIGAAGDQGSYSLAAATSASGAPSLAGTAGSASLGQPALAPQSAASTPLAGAAQHASLAQSAAPQPAARPQYPYEIYDSVTPSAIPPGHVIATYADGPFAVPASQVAGRPVLWIDTNGSDPTGAQALDIEPGDATPAMAATWTAQKLDADPSAQAILYTMQSDWPAVQAAVGSLPQWMQSHVKYWIADPTGYPHVVPGSSATQWYWGTNYDISTANPGF